METVLILIHVHAKLAGKKFCTLYTFGFFKRNIWLAVHLLFVCLGRVLFVINVFVYLDVKMGTVKIQWNVFVMMDGKECFVTNVRTQFEIV